MRKLLRRKGVTILAAIVSFTAIPVAGIVATATPALASVTICNAFGHGYCIGAPNLGNGDRVVLTTSGRQINRIDQNFTCCGGFEVFRLQVAAAPSQCVGMTNANGITLQVTTLRDCSGGSSNNTNWGMEPVGNGNFKWILPGTFGLVLDSDNTLGSQMRLEGAEPCNNCFERWTN